MIKSGFPAIVGRNAGVLILGTMPGAESLRKNRYYANPHNAFWFIIGRLLRREIEPLSYIEKARVLKANNIALWDVIKSCEREGSLDSSIVGGSITVNDFAAWYSKHRTIKRVFFNGAGAEKEYKKRVLPFLPDRFGYIRYLKLPSTSPAMAKLTREAKLAAWSAITDKF